MNTGIYAIENTVNGKMYVGSAVNLKQRKYGHFSGLQRGKHANAKLQNSYNKHGEGAFAFRPLLVCRKEDLLFYEQLAIDKYDAVKTGYNIASVAGSVAGVKHSLRIRVNHSAEMITRWSDPEYKAKTKAAMIVRWTDPEYKTRMKAILEARWTDPGFKVRHRAAMQNVRADPEYKAKMDAALRERMASPEAKAKHRAAMEIVRTDPEYKAKIGAASKARWADPKYRIAMSEKHSARMKAYYAAKKAA